MTAPATQELVEVPNPTLTAFAALRFAAFELLQARRPEATEETEAALRNALDRLQTIDQAQGVNWSMSQISGAKFKRYQRLRRAADDFIHGSTPRRHAAVELRFAVEAIGRLEKQTG